MRLVAVLLLCLAACPVRAESPAQWQGPDRIQRLTEGARRERVVNLYSSMVERDLRQIVAAFERRHGIKVNVWRSGKLNVLQRAVAEARAGRHEVDVVHNPSLAMEALYREGLLQPVASPRHAALIPQAVAAHRQWAGPRVYIFVQAYNTQKVSKDELPSTYADLLHPRWKGRIAVENKEQEWFQALLQNMGEAEGLTFFRSLAAKQQLSVRQGMSLINNLLAAGDVHFALTMYSYLPEQAKRAGAPVDWIALKPTIAVTDGVGVMARAPHPHAAVLLYDFMLGEGLELMAGLNHVVSDRRVLPELERLQVRFIDPAAAIGDYDRWTQLYEDTINARSGAAAR